MWGYGAHLAIILSVLVSGTLSENVTFPFTNLSECLALGSQIWQRAKCVVDSMEIAWGSCNCPWDWEAWYDSMKPFWSEDMIYDSSWTPNGDFSNNTGLKEFFDNEHILFNLAFDNVTFSTLIWVGGETTASLIAYAKANWIGDLGTVPGSLHWGQEVTIWDLDFYRIDETGEKIKYNWCLIDFVDLMRQVGYQVLPKHSLEEGMILPPAAMDGIPAPITRLVNSEDSLRAKKIIEELLKNDFVEGSEPSSMWSGDMVWYGGAGFGLARGIEEYEVHFLGPLRKGLSQRELQLDVLHCEGAYCGVIGFIQAVHSGEWLGEHPTDLPIRLRVALHWRVDFSTGLVAECWAMFDLPAAFNMIGINLFDRINDNYRIK